MRSCSAASVLRADGRILVRNLPMPEPVVLGPETPAMRAIAAADRGHCEARAVTDGVTRICAFERIGDLPLYAIGVAGQHLARHAARSVRTEAAEAALAFSAGLLAEAETTAAARETMLRELSHRVKNSLQPVQSLIRLEGQRPRGAGSRRDRRPRARDRQDP